MKCVGYFLFYYFQYCVSKVGRAFEGKPVLMFASVSGIKEARHQTEAQNYDKPQHYIRSRNA